MNSCELVTFVSSVACAISRCHTADEVELMGTVFTQLGDTLTTINTFENQCKNNKDDSDPSDSSKTESSDHKSSKARPKTKLSGIELPDMEPIETRPPEIIEWM